MRIPQETRLDTDFDALFARFYSRLARLLYRITGDTERAEEIASEAFWRLHQKPPATNVNVEGWLYRTGTRLALDDLKKRQRRRRYEALASLFGTPSNPHQLLEQSEGSARIRRALLALKTDQAAMILLRNEGFTYAEVAAAAWQWLAVGRVEIVRVDFSSLPDAARSLNPTLMHEPAPPQPAADPGRAAAMAGFVPRLPPESILPGAPRLSVMSPMSFGMTVNTSDVELALRMARVIDQPVPREWDGAKPDISLMQTQPPALSAPSSFDLGEFTIALLRAAGMSREQAERFGRRMNTTPVLLFGIGDDEHAAVSDVPLRSGGSGTLIENYGDSGKLERVELLWSAGDRVFVFSGATSVELAKAVANSTE